MTILDALALIAGCSLLVGSGYLLHMSHMQSLVDHYKENH